MKKLKRSEPTLNRAALRAVDANLNRAREGLRVLEDGCRFILEDERLYKGFREIRHALDKETRSFYPELVKSRDAQTDMGKGEIAGSQSEMSGVMTANIRRAQEALRVLEEFSRLFPGPAHQRFKTLRFKLYTLEKKLIGHFQ